MTIDTYKKAKRLFEDIEKIETQLKEVKEKQHWITTSTPDNQLDGAFSWEFQKDLEKWLYETKDRYLDEFNNLT